MTSNGSAATAPPAAKVSTSAVVSPVAAQAAPAGMSTSANPGPASPRTDATPTEGATFNLRQYVPGLPLTTASATTPRWAATAPPLPMLANALATPLQAYVVPD